MPGSRVIASVGNEQNALLFWTLILTIPMLIMIVIFGQRVERRGP